MISALLSDFWPYIATALAGIVAFLLRRSGAKAERTKHRLKEMKDHAETTERINKTPRSRDSAAARDRLSKRE